MCRKINITLILFTIWISTYTVIGKENLLWSNVHYMVESLLLVFIFSYLKEIKNVLKWLVNLIMSYFILRFSVSFIGLLFSDLGNRLNSNEYLMVFTGLMILIWMILNRKK